MAAPKPVSDGVLCRPNWTHASIERNPPQESAYPVAGSDETTSCRETPTEPEQVDEIGSACGFQAVRDGSSIDDKGCYSADDGSPDRKDDRRYDNEAENEQAAEHFDHRKPRLSEIDAVRVW